MPPHNIHTRELTSHLTALETPAVQPLAHAYHTFIVSCYTTSVAQDRNTRSPAVAEIADRTVLEILIG